jgi:hypothetical protein
MGSDSSHQVSESGRHLVLCLQSTASDPDANEQLVGRLRELKRQGTIDSFEVEMWDRYIDTTSDDVPSSIQRARALLETFDNWAGLHESSIDGWGSNVAVGRGRMGHSTDIRRTPTTLLAEYVDGGLERVTPCANERLCVGARLEQLAAEGAARERASAKTRRAARQERSSERRRPATERRDREPPV